MHYYKHYIKENFGLSVENVDCLWFRHGSSIICLKQPVYKGVTKLRKLGRTKDLMHMSGRFKPEGWFLPSTVQFFKGRGENQKSVL